MGRPCSCQCTKIGRGCKNGVVGRQDPKKALCDLCYYEIITMSHIRRQPVCQYPAKLPSTLDRIIGR
ncbi:hypothetical protein PG984_016406 [Apiospora sp. TS-2023a]|uniref:Uncharacterized protein n=1 Tax=Apiospora saccharicola TaxID=335842 RepID=A0ABR1VBK8_9PEZI